MMLRSLLFRGTYGGGNWLASQSRPDLSVMVSLGLQCMPRPTVAQLAEANTMVRRAKQFSDLTIKWKTHSFFRFDRCPSHRCLLGKRTTTWNTGGLHHWFHNKESQHWRRGTMDSLDLAILQATTRGSFNAFWRGSVLGLRFGHVGVGYASHLRSTGWTCPRCEVTRRLFVAAHQQAVVDCKSLYDHATAPTSPGGTDDKRCAIDVLIIRESLGRLKCTLRWTPGDRMLADALTKNSADPADLLRSCIRRTCYQISDETSLLQHRAQEKDRRQRLGVTRAARSHVSHGSIQGDQGNEGTGVCSTKELFFLGKTQGEGRSTKFTTPSHPT